ncbi:membrane protein of unknown function [Candidatus Promineifilum breve]|uniref:Glycosyltransferase RgtA/B/C/D-like domain-containing protein n=2 Tax=Candidatus Promineifilum breve TaxID=1806508 RepID=A0A160SZP9_9CHLR|nr:membrane protein of unknown function [Candidatus Promineifilum breve]
MGGLLARLVALGRYVTPDEAIWVYRSLRFREALLAGRWADTLVAGHPGVTTTWLGALGMSVQMAFDGGARAAYDWLTTMAGLTPENVEAFRRLALLLSGGRVAVALVNALGIVAVYWLARRLWGGPAALLAALFLAFDPFLAGLSGLLHVDGLSATFSTLALLLLISGIHARETPEAKRRLWLALAGAAAGLAVLSKTPTLLLLPLSGAAMLWPVACDRDRPARSRLLRFVFDALAWGAALLATVVVLYPALWVAPLDVLAMVGGSANRHLDEALRETFFMGRIAFDHGPLFYPVVLLWRLSPVVWLALIPAVGWVIDRRRRALSTDAVWPVALLLLWVVLFLLAITPAAKKFDRYILPVVPALLILAAVAWAGWVKAWPRLGGRLLTVLAAGQMIYWLAFAAYPLTAYNPLVGGARTAVAMLPIGWGEGIGAAARRLAATQPGVVAERAMAGVVPSLAPFFPGQTLVAGLDDPATADYVIVTLGGRQLDPAGVAAQTAGLELLSTEHFGGLDQAWTYRNPTPVAAAVPPPLSDAITFGERITLTAFGRQVASDLLTLALRWRRGAPPAADERFTLRLAVQDTAGNVWVAQEADLLNDVAFFPPDWATDESGTVRYRLELPPGMPPATYQVMLSVIDRNTNGQLPARGAAGELLGVMVNVGEIVTPAPETVVTATRMQIAVAGGRMWLDGRLQLLGAGQTAGEALAGSRLPVELFWHVPQGTLPPGLELAWTLRDATGTARPVHTSPLSRYDTGLWRTGESIHEMYRVPLPPDLPPGPYSLEIALVTPAAGVSEEPYRLADVQINNIERHYEAEVAVPFAVSFGALDLLGLATADLSARPGESPEVTLYWQKRAPHGEVYSVFVHVLDEAGAIVQQADHWPGGLPTDILDAGQIVTDRFPIPLPADLPPGDYRLRVGLYSADSGLRLPVLGADDTSAIGETGDSVMLPAVLRVRP